VNRLAPVVLCVAALAAGCVARPDPRDAGDYLRYVAFRQVVGKESYLLHWRRDEMPLRVYAMRPPEGLFEDPDIVHEAVLDGVFNWTDAVEPGVPSFALVDDPGEADIPVVWEERPDGSYYVAHCVYGPVGVERRLSVERILLTGRWSETHVATPDEVHRAVLHETGHALGLAGHSPNPNDIMATTPERWLELPRITRRDRRTLQRLYEKPVGARVLGAKRERY
jgi:predicted Zn-dependent protease